MKVLVYGTLKSRRGNNYLLDGARLIGDDILPGVKLFYSYGNGGFPVAKITNDPNDRVFGEVWDLTPNPDIIHRLDRLEGVPRMYTREILVTEKYKTVYTYIGGSMWNFDELNSVGITDGLYVW